LKSDHLVVCEQGEELSEVIAANYAYSIGADLVLIPERSRDEAEKFLERFYGANDPGISTTLVLEELALELRALAGHIPVPPGGWSATHHSIHVGPRLANPLTWIRPI
jgi:hypothetical protein